MSEYQYYEFQAIDRPLTREEMERLRSFSTRAQITSTSFTNEYHWGDFKGDPVAWMDEYFDAFLYLANWGTRWLMLRFPKTAFDGDFLDQYVAGDSFGFRVKDDFVTLSFDVEIEPDGWVEGEGCLASLVPLRSDVLQGDYRALYIGWLLAVQQCEADETSIEPPVPPGLSELTPALESLCEFLDIDLDLLDAAAESSGPSTHTELSDAEIRRWVSQLPAGEKDRIIAELVQNRAAHFGADLRRRAKTELRESSRTSPNTGRRTAGDLLARADVLACERDEREKAARARIEAKREAAAAAARQRRLESIVGNEAALWKKIDALIQTRQPRRYDEAVAMTQDLRDAAAMAGETGAFQTRLADLLDRHNQKVSLISRLRAQGLAP